MAQRRSEIEEQAKQASNDAIGAAQACLKSPLFDKYRIEYEYLETKLIDQLMMIDEMETDPVKYGFQVKDVVSKMRHIRALLQGIRKDGHQRA